MFYKLYSSCLFEKGADEGCIINLSNNKIFKLDSAEQDIIEALEEGEKVEKIERDISPMLDQLTKEGYGEYFEKPVFFDKIHVGVPDSYRNGMERKITAYGLYLNITNKCNMDCYYCSDDIQVKKHTGCKRWSTDTDRITFDQYHDTIKQACDFGCRVVFILGGEPFLEKNLLFQIIKFIRTSTSIKEVNIATNGYLLDDDIINNLKNETLVINTIAHNDQVLNEIDRNGNSVEILKRNIEKLKENNIAYRFHLVVSKENYKKIDDIHQYYSDISSKGHTIDCIYDESDENYLSFYLKQMGKDIRNNINETQIYYNMVNHPCLNGVLTLFSDGIISVCPMMKGETIGNIKEDSLYDIFQDENFRKYWRMPLSALDKCGECCYQLICKDCRAVEKCITGDLYKKTICPKKYI